MAGTGQSEKHCRRNAQRKDAKIAKNTKERMFYTEICDCLAYYVCLLCVVFCLGFLRELRDLCVFALRFSFEFSRQNRRQTIQRSLPAKTAMESATG